MFVKRQGWDAGNRMVIFQSVGEINSKVTSTSIDGYKMV